MLGSEGSNTALRRPIRVPARIFTLLSTLSSSTLVFFEKGHPERADNEGV